jgi:hypothetical protein
MDHIINEVVALAKEEDVRIWTATQLNRSGMVAENPGFDGIAGAINKIFPVDFACFLGQTKEEKQAQILRMLVAKNRNGPAGGQVTIDTDYGYYTFYKANGGDTSQEDAYVVD